MAQNKTLIQIDAEFKDIIPGFLERRKNEIPVFRDFLDQQDFRSLELFGHKIKGSSGGYGFDYIGSIGATIELAAKEKAAAKIEKAITDLAVHLENLEVTYVEQ